MMLLSHKTVVKLTDKEMNIIGHLCYAASKLWNVCNYERIHYKEHLKEKYQINDNYLFLKNKIFKNIDKIKQLHIYPPEKGTCEVIVVYEISEVAVQADNGHYLSVDLGLHNLMTCYDSQGASFIMGRKYLSLCRRYDKEIARVQSQWARQQSSKGEKYPKPSKHVRRLYQKRGNCVKDYLHKMTHSLVEYCIKNDIKTVIIGDIRNIRKGKDLGSRTNQKLHGLPYEKIYGMIEYKLKMAGIRFVKQEESYTSQCSPYKKDISKETAQKSNRKERGLYVVKGEIFNADAVGAFNIMRKYFAVSGIEKEMSVSGLKSIKVQKVAV